MYRYFVCALTLAALVEGVPFSKIQDYWNRRYCDTEDLTLAITCGDSYAQYMKWLEERLMKEPDLKDPTRCLYYKYDDIVSNIHYLFKLTYANIEKIEY